MRRGSGKQILLQILYDLSIRKLPDSELDEADRRLRAGILLHGSTADESFELASRLCWRTDIDKFGSCRQGAATRTGVLVSDIFETMVEMPGLRGYLLEQYPGLDNDDLEAAEWFMWLVISAVQMFGGMNSVEVVDEPLDIEAWVDAMTKHYEYYFRRS